MKTKDMIFSSLKIKDDSNVAVISFKLLYLKILKLKDRINRKRLIKTGGNRERERERERNKYKTTLSQNFKNCSKKESTKER